MKRSPESSEPVRRGWVNWRKVTAGAYLVAAVSVPLIVAEYLIDQVQVGRYRADAQDIADNRNTCSIQNVTVASASGRLALKITVGLTSKTGPDSLKDTYRDLDLDATFKDDTDSRVSGIEVINATHGLTARGSAPGDGPTGTNTITLTAPVLSADAATYRVYHESAIDYMEGKWLVFGGKHGVAAGRPVRCGSFEYQPGGGVPLIAR